MVKAVAVAASSIKALLLEIGVSRSLATTSNSTFVSPILTGSICVGVQGKASVCASSVETFEEQETFC